MEFRDQTENKPLRFLYFRNKHTKIDTLNSCLRIRKFRTKEVNILLIKPRLIKISKKVGS